MNVNSYDTLSEATQALKERGFGIEYCISEDIRLTATNWEGRTYGPEEVTVAEFHRFEGESDPSDMTIIYALETPRGDKGILIDAFGAASDEKVDEFVKELEVKHPTNEKPGSAEFSEREGALHPGVK